MIFHGLDPMKSRNVGVYLTYLRLGASLSSSLSVSSSVRAEESESESESCSGAGVEGALRALQRGLIIALGLNAPRSGSSDSLLMFFFFSSFHFPHGLASSSWAV